VNPASAARTPHRVGRRSLRRLVEQRTHAGMTGRVAAASVPPAREAPERPIPPIEAMRATAR
jgi:hypothetical protein